MNQDGPQSQSPANGVPQNIVNLPSVAPAMQPVAPENMTHAGSTPIIAAVTRAKAVLSQYQNDPFHLSIELEQIKSAYVTEQFHVTISPVED